jgi:hypothetical protein
MLLIAIKDCCMLGFSVSQDEWDFSQTLLHRECELRV